MADTPKQTDLQPGEAGTAPTPIFDPDRDGKPGISLPAALVLVAAIVGFVVLALNGSLDLNDLLINGGLGTAIGAALMRLFVPAKS